MTVFAAVFKNSVLNLSISSALYMVVLQNDPHSRGPICTWLNQSMSLSMA